MTEFSQQGFEASHKDQRQLWLKASSHDQHGEASSSKPFSWSIKHITSNNKLGNLGNVKIGYRRLCTAEGLVTHIFS